MRTAIALFAFAAVLGCGKNAHQTENQTPSKQPVIVNVSIENASSNALNGVKLDWQGPDVSAGILSPGIVKTDVSIPWPSAPSAKIRCIDYKTRKPYTIDVSLSIVNEQVDAGGIQHVTFRILVYGRLWWFANDFRRQSAEQQTAPAASPRSIE